MKKEYDFLIVGSGLYGSVLAHELKKKNKKVLVIDKRDHIGGNIFTYKEDNINVHKYGAHIFHTSNEKVWNYLSSLVTFNSFINSPLAYYKNNYYHLPFNMNTFKEIFGLTTKEEVIERINEEIKKENIKEINNLEDQAISLVGRTIYEILVKGYTEKQWGKKCNELPSFIIKRLPLRFEYNNNYFNDKYQGVVEGGYTLLIEKLLEGIEVRLNLDYNDKKIRKEYQNIADYIIYTGAIDEYYDYKFGELEYRSLDFKIEKYNQNYYQKNCVINYTESEVPYTRIIEHKYFLNDDSNKTIITKEYPKSYKKGDERYYPVNDLKNNNLFNKYKEESLKETNVFFGGRLGNYKYYDMDDVVELALNDAELLKNKKII